MVHLATGNPINFCLTPTMNKTHHGPAITPFSGQILPFLAKFL